MDASYPFNRGFRLKLLSLLLDPLWHAKFGSLILPEYFDTDDEEAIAKAIIQYKQAYGKVPTDPDDVIALCGDHDEVICDLFRGYDDLDLAKDLAIQFAQERAAKLAILDSIDDVKLGHLDVVIERMREALAIGDDLRSPGIDLIGDIDKWLYALWSDKVPTGWRHVDAVLEGGLGPGELGLIMGPTNRGKSMALVNVGYGAAGIGSGKNVVHITHEMSASVVAKRYAARMVFRFPSKRDGDVYEDELRYVAAKLMPGNIRIIDLGRSSISSIRDRLDRLVVEGYKFDLVIDDYPDLLESSRQYTQRRFELSLVYEELRALGDDYGVPVWGATHSNRASFSKEVITLQDVAEDIGKARIADVIVALCQTREEEESDRCRLFMAKVRDGVKHTMIAAKFFGDAQAIVTTRVVRRRSSDNDN